MNWSDRRVLVTGGAGFVGSHLALALDALGARVTVIDDYSSAGRDNLRAASNHLCLIEASIVDFDWSALLPGVDTVFHLAANADVPRSVREPARDFAINALGSQRLFLAARDAQVRRVVFASSAAVYGEPRADTMTEDHSLHPVSPYGASKLAAEQLGFAYCASYRLPFTAVRIFNSYGERLPRYVMYDLLTRLRGGPATLQMLGTGAQLRDFSYVGDGVQLFLRAAESERAIGRAYNLCTGRTITIQQLVEKVIAPLGLRDRTRVSFSGTSWPGDIQRLVGDPARAREELCFVAATTLEQGLLLLIDWTRNSLGWNYERAGGST